MGTLHGWESFGDGVSVSNLIKLTFSQLTLRHSLTSKPLPRGSEQGKSYRLLSCIHLQDLLPVVMCRSVLF
jgi:hypothetical protein